MFCLYVWGSSYLGNCDYFEHEKLGQLHVAAFSFHFCFLPLYIRKTELHLPNQRAVNVDHDVRGASLRCILWAWLRTGLLLLGLGMVGFGLARVPAVPTPHFQEFQFQQITQLCTPLHTENCRPINHHKPVPHDFLPAPAPASVAPLILVCGGAFSFVLAVVAFLYKPRASESARAEYCAKLNTLFIFPESAAPESEMTSV